MRAKQQPTQLPQSSLALTILPSAANDRGRKSRATEAPAAVAAPPAPPAPAPVPEAIPAPMEYAGAPTAAAPATPPAPDWAPPPVPAAPPAADWAPPPAPPAQAWAPPPAQTAPTAPSWTPPPQTWAPPSTSRFGNPPADYQVNYPSAPGFPPQPSYTASPGIGYPPAAPGQVTPGQWVPQHAGPGYAPGGPRQRSTASRVLIALAITVVGIIALGILAAIAIPVFLSQRDKTAARNVSLPAMLVEQQQVHDSGLDAASAAVVAGLERDISGLTQVQSAYYGSDGQPLFMVAAGKLPHQASAADTKAYFNTSANTGSEQVVLAPVGSGPFGGKMECGTATIDGNPTTVCSSLDSAAAVIVISSQVSTSQLAVLTRQIISSIEQKS